MAKTLWAFETVKKKPKKAAKKPRKPASKPRKAPKATRAVATVKKVVRKAVKPAPRASQPTKSPYSPFSPQPKTGRMRDLNCTLHHGKEGFRISCTGARAYGDSRQSFEQATGLDVGGKNIRSIKGLESKLASIRSDPGVRRVNYDKRRGWVDITFKGTANCTYDGYSSGPIKCKLARK